MPAIRVVKNLLFGTVVVLIGTVIVVAAGLAAIQVYGDAPQIPDSWYLAVAIAMAVVAIGVSVRARAAQELQRQVDRMCWTHTERALEISTETTRRLAEKLNDKTLAALAEIEARTRGLTSIERAQAGEALEQVEAVRSILQDLRDRDLPLLSVTQEALTESSALLTLAASTLADVAETPEQAVEAEQHATACAMGLDH